MRPCSTHSHPLCFLSDLADPSFLLFLPLPSQSRFTDSTLLTIAHRLSTIMDYDRVLVLDNGRIVEFDTPYNLLTSEGEGEGLFKGMVKRTGRWEEMMEVARRKEEEGRS